MKIKSIFFKKDSTEIGFDDNISPKDSSFISYEKTPKTVYDLPRHADFERAMDVLKPHLAIANGWAEPLDAVDNILTEEDFKEFFADSDEAAFGFRGLTVTGILIQGKNAVDGVQIFGTKECINAENVSKVKTYSIALERTPEGFNYPLIEILDNQIDRLLLEAEKYKNKKKHGSGVQQTLNVA